MEPRNSARTKRQPLLRNFYPRICATKRGLSAGKRRHFWGWVGGRLNSVSIDGNERHLLVFSQEAEHILFSQFSIHFFYGNQHWFHATPSSFPCAECSWLLFRCLCLPAARLFCLFSIFLKLVQSVRNQILWRVYGFVRQVPRQMRKGCESTDKNRFNCYSSSNTKPQLNSHTALLTNIYFSFFAYLLSKLLVNNV